MYITNLLAEDLVERHTNIIPFSVLHQALIALRFYASASFLQVVGDTIGDDKSTVSRACKCISGTCDEVATAHQVA